MKKSINNLGGSKNSFGSKNSILILKILYIFFSDIFFVEKFICPILHIGYKNQFSTKQRKRLHNLFRFFHLHCRWWYLSPISLNPTRRYVPRWMQWRSWTRTLDCGLEKLVFIIFLETLDEIAVHFSSQDVFDIWIFCLMTEGKQENKMHWFFRTGICTSVWRNGRHQCHMHHHWHCSFFSTPTPSSSKRQS